ncbi:type II toxin-antitoxin system YoeB family toxin [Arthrobacter alpinus]|uniref:type II toxin-antitoxin system YoeB family toxin n=1 Tax=Arthrobacter alpinus TaxID=656366 RepID=UPI00094314C1
MNGRVLAWTAEGWADYLYWQPQKGKNLKRINTLIEDILQDDPFDGIAKLIGLSTTRTFTA